MCTFKKIRENDHETIPFRTIMVHSERGYYFIITFEDTTMVSTDTLINQFPAVHTLNCGGYLIIYNMVNRYGGYGKQSNINYRKSKKPKTGLTETVHSGH